MVEVNCLSIVSADVLSIKVLNLNQGEGSLITNSSKTGETSCNNIKTKPSLWHWKLESFKSSNFYRRSDSSL